MTDNEIRLRMILQRLVERLDYANISFDELGGERAVEAALEFDDAYVEACEALGMDLPAREPAAILPS